VNLGFAQIYLSLMIDGIGSRPFSAVTIPPIEPPVRSFRKEVIAASRAHFASPRARIEEAILTELSLTTEEAKTATEARPEGKPSYQKTPSKNNQNQYRTNDRPRPPQQQNAPRQQPSVPEVKVVGLKEVIQAITHKVDEVREKVEEVKHESLKETLEKVAAVQPSQPWSPQPVPPSKARPPQAQSRPPQSRPTPPPVQREKAAFEVPKESLEAVFKGDT
jgi:hypothetical protein